MSDGSTSNKNALVMKYIHYINWAMLIFYACYFIYGLITIGSSGGDAAGKGLTQAYLFIGLFIAFILIGLNFISVDWLRVVILILTFLPIYMSLKTAYRQYHNRWIIKNKMGRARAYKDPHLKKIVHAIDKYDLESVRQLLAEDDSGINEMAEGLSSILGGAAHNASIGYSPPEAMKIVRLLIEHGADPKIYPSNGAPPLNRVATRGSYELFEMLLKAGADPNGKDENGVAVLYHLVRDYHYDHSQKVDLLLNEYGADPNIAFGDEGWMLNYSALLFAVSNRSWEVANLLVDKGADLNFTPVQGSNFWQYLEIAKQQYREEGEAPEGFKKFLENPKVIGYDANGDTNSEE